MRLRTFLLLLVFFLFYGLVGNSATPISLHRPPTDSLLVKHSIQLLTTSSNRHIEELIGRKLSLKEKLTLWTARRVKTIDPALEKKANSQALTGFLLSLAGLLLFPLLPSIAAIALTSAALKKDKENPGTLSKNKDLAQIGFVIGIIGVALGALLILLLALYFSIGPRR